MEEIQDDFLFSALKDWVDDHIIDQIQELKKG